MFDNEVKRNGLILRLIISAVVTALCGFCFIACGTGDNGTHGGANAQPLSAPQNLTVSGEVLRWDEVESATGYEVEIDGKIYNTEKAELDVFLITDATKTYSMRVKAVDGKSGSEWSSSVEYSVTVASIKKATLINNYTAYEIDGTSVEDAGGKLIIPEKFKGLPIASIASETFKDCKGLTSVYISDTVKTIGDFAFSGCDGLVTARLSKQSAIARGMFSGCVNLKNIYLYEGVGIISYDAFENCRSLTDITIPGSVTRILSQAFNGCSAITEIVLPAKVTDVGISVFANCDSLSSISVDPNNTVYKSDANCVIKLRDNSLVCGIKTSVIPDYVTDIGAYAFSGCGGLTEITIPGTVNRILSSAFSRCTSLKKVTVESGVQLINNAFYGCSALEEVALPDTLTQIIGGIFNACDNLKTITVEGNTPDPIYKSDGNCIISIEDNALIAGCMWSDIPDYVESIKSGAFDYLPIKHLTVKTNSADDKEYGVLELPSGLKAINGGFYYCTELRSIRIPDGLTAISANAFTDCYCLESVIITENSQLTFANREVFGESTIYTSCDTIPDGWNVPSASKRDYTIVTGCTFADEGGQLYVDSFVVGDYIKGLNDKYPLYIPYRKGHTFKGWAQGSRDGESLGELSTRNRVRPDQIVGIIITTVKVGESLNIAVGSVKNLPADTVVYAVWEEAAA